MSGQWWLVVAGVLVLVFAVVIYRFRVPLAGFQARAARQNLAVGQRAADWGARGQTPLMMTVVAAVWAVIGVVLIVTGLLGRGAA